MEYNFNEYVAVQSEVDILAENKEAMALIKTFDGTAKNSRGAFVAKAVSDLKMNVTTAGAYWQRNKKFAVGTPATPGAAHAPSVVQTTPLSNHAAMELLKTFNYKDNTARDEFVEAAMNTLNMNHEEAQGFWLRNKRFAVHVEPAGKGKAEVAGPVGKDNLSRAAVATWNKWKAEDRKVVKVDGSKSQSQDGYMSRDGGGPQGRPYRFGIYDTTRYIMVGVVLFPAERYAYFTDGDGKRSQPELVTAEIAKDLVTKVKNLGEALDIPSAPMIFLINETARLTAKASEAAKGAAGEMAKFSAQADVVEKALYDLDAIAQRIGPHLMDDNFASGVRYFATEMRKNLAAWKVNIKKTK